jgi:hypothetical protein
MKTTQELRALEAIKADSRDPDFENFSFRSNRATTPHAWDDIHRGDKGRSWKNYRRTKWCR